MNAEVNKGLGMDGTTGGMSGDVTEMKMCRYGHVCTMQPHTETIIFYSYCDDNIRWRTSQRRRKARLV